jgi:sugar phosphate isomerase/epimerase
MRLSGERHLSYCSNVHAGESWREVRDAVLPRIAEVKARAGSEGDFGVGLRLSAAATEALTERGAQMELSQLLAAQGLYAFTFNGFPFGEFHRAQVKAAVYRPDWRDPRRRLYTDRLAELLAQLLPEHVAYGSISSVPFGFRADFASDAAFRAAAENLLQHIAFLHRLRERTGRRIVLALEPEPFCALETGEDCVHAFDAWLRSPAALKRLAELCDEGSAAALRIVHDHLGVCLDTCHAAVEFEDPSELVRCFAQHQIPIYKVQLSAGLRVVGVSEPQRDALCAFAEDTYLHQVVEQSEKGLRHYLDLPEALQDRSSGAREWRIHFHVPIFQEDYGLFTSTQSYLLAQIAALRGTACSHFEVETYTWSVLPATLRGSDLIADIASELAFARARLEEC